MAPHSPGSLTGIMAPLCMAEKQSSPHNNVGKPESKTTIVPEMAKIEGPIGSELIQVSTLSELPKGCGTQTLRQAAILRVQRRHGNNYALRFITATLQKQPRDAQSVPRGQSAPAAPISGRLISEFARNHIFQQVGNGQCAALAIIALRTAGARTRYPSQSGHPVWGVDVSLAYVQEGDILQFENHRVVIRNADGTGTIERRGQPAHTAIVLENLGGGVLRIAEQNLIGSGSPGVTISTIFVSNQVRDTRTIRVEGNIWAYRPQAQSQIPTPQRQQSRRRR